MALPLSQPLRNLTRGLIDFVFPSHCYVCNVHLPDPEEYICPGCLDSLALLPEPFCAECKEIKINQEPHRRCNTFSQRAYALLNYDEKTAILIHKFKYENRMGLGEILAGKLAFRLTQVGFCDFDLVAPVPLYHSRKRERGYNQAELIAKVISSINGWLLSAKILKRIRNTQDQTHLSAPERRENVKGAFKVCGGIDITGKKVLLVDDVITTGATLEECARSLKEDGAKSVSACTLARGV